MNNPHQVLVVDGSLDNLRRLGQVLEKSGYEVSIATDAIAALERMKMDPLPELILLDVLMPGMDGFELLRKWKCDPKSLAIPVMLLGGPSDVERKIQGFQLGAVDYIAKPYHAEEVVARVGALVQLLGVDRLRREIAERERSEDALRRSEALLRKAQRIAHIGSWSWDIANERLEWSGEMFSIFGISRDSFTGSLQEVVAKAIHPDDRERVERSNRDVMEQNRPGAQVYRVVHPDGAVRTVWAEPGELVLDENGKAAVLTGIVQDITELRQAEDAAREIQERLRFAIETSGIGAWDLDLGNRSANRSLKHDQIFGYQEALSDWTYEKFLEHVHEQDRDEVDAKFRHALESRGEWNFECRIRRADGQLRWIWAAGRHGNGAAGTASRMAGIVQDITERKGMLEALRRSEERYRSLLQTAMDGFLLFDLEGRIVETNQAYCTMSGYSPEEMVGKSLAELDTSDAVSDLSAGIRRLMEAGRGRFRTRHRRKDGDLLDMEVSVNFWPGDGGRIVAFLRDITGQLRAEAERRSLQEQFQQLQKMESIGCLAGGVAHDFNNMLGVIQGHAEIVMLGLPETSPFRPDISTILNATRKSADLTRQLLAFARREVVAPRNIDLNENTSGILAMMRRLIGENVDLVWAPCPGLWTVLVDPSQFDQILTNLCLNARDAIQGEGTIEVRLSNRVVPTSDSIRNPEIVPGEYVELSVSDTGCGMDDRTVSRIFEPFFTTKALGKGTGLGLATVYGAVKQNKGFIEVRSQIGKGTTFVILLPRHADGRIAAANDNTSPASSRQESILLVEDDPNLLDLTKSMLEIRGYKVIPANGPKKAIEIARDRGDAIELVLTDVMMPGMNGRELGEKLRMVAPGLKLLFMSGYTSDVIATHGVLDEGVNFIEKPFSVAELSRKVREVLDKPSVFPAARS